MNNFFKKTLWAALLTVAFTLNVGCSSQDDSSVSSEDAGASSSVADNADATDSSATSTGSYSYSVNDDGTISINGYSGTDAELNLPSTLDGYVVSAIKDHAFEANWDLTSITLPSGLTSIGEGAFMDCSSLTSISIPETVSQIDRAAFAGCTSLTSITLPASVSTVLEEAFTGCVSLTTLTVANADLAYDSWGLIESGENLSCTIISPSGSLIETWALENGFTTEVLS